VPETTNRDPQAQGQTAEMLGLTDDQLPEFFATADASAASAQDSALRSSGVRLAGIVAAALGGTFSIVVGQVDIWAAVALLGFLLALGAEIYILLVRPEQRWYQARAGAESAKTLSWRYSVGADPFFLALSTAAADSLFRERLGQVAQQVHSSVRIPAGDGGSPTSGMKSLRAASLKSRRAVYLRDRTEVQRDWYTAKAEANRVAASRWRVFLLFSEVVAVTLASARLFGLWEIDVAGILAAVIGAGAAWLSLKQHVTLRAAYSLTAAELQKQMGMLRAANEQQWSSAVADAEEAISREHTMWLASRGEVNEVII